MSKKNLPIFLRDTREKQDKGWKWRASKNVGGTTIAKLDYGDYSVEGYQDKIAVERKGSATELMQNLLTEDNKRFKKELAALSDFQHKIIICEFDIKDLASAHKFVPRRYGGHFSMDKLLGAIASFQVQFGVPFVFTGKPRVIYRKGEKRVINYGKDLAKKFLLKASKYAK